MNKAEIIITLAVLIVCVVVFVIIQMGADSGSNAVITCDGKEAARIPLDNYGKFTLPDTGEMVFEIDENGIRVVSSDCPDKICVKTGYVTTENASAVCLPNKVIVTVEVDHDE